MSNKVVTDMTEAIVSDDYEEGEILDDDTLYDDVSSLEEFSCSDTEQKSNGKRSSKVRKPSGDGSKIEKSQRRKDHRCKQNSICRKERSGKHCYTRIRNSKISPVLAAEKVQVVDLTSPRTRENLKKKPHGVLSPVYDPHTRSGGGRLPILKDYHEKENRYSQRYARHRDSHRSPPQRLERKKECKKLKSTGSRPYDSRKRTRSRSPKLNPRDHSKEVSRGKGKTSLLKRLVGSGSIGVKTINEEPVTKKSAAQKDLVVSKLDEPKSDDDDYCVEVIEIKDDPVVIDLSIETPVEPEENCEQLSSRHETSIINDATNAKVIPEVTRATQNTEACNNDAENGTLADHSDSFLEITENIDELSLRLEALRTAMLRKHRERKKKGFTCKRKSGVEDDSFTAYALGYDDKEKSTVETGSIKSVNVEASLSDGNAEIIAQLPRTTTDVSQPKTSHEGLNLSNNPKRNDLKETNAKKDVSNPSSGRIMKLLGKLRTNRVRRLDWSQKRAYGKAVMERKLVKREYYAQQRRRRKELQLVRTQSNSHINDTINEVSDEEIELRELALKSVKEKVKSYDGTSEAMVQNLNYSEETGDKQVDIFNNLRVEVDNISVKPIVSCDSEGTPTNFYSNEAWDDIDEDILRAQLLSSLSCKMPRKNESTKTSSATVDKKQIRGILRVENKCCDSLPDKKLKLIRQKINKENFKKLAKTKYCAPEKSKAMQAVVSQFDKFNDSKLQLLQKQQGPVVPKLIISLNAESSSEDEEEPSSKDCDKSEVVRSIDQFLQEARIENDLKQGLIIREVVSTPQAIDDTKSNFSKQPIPEKKIVEARETNSADGRATSQVLKHLPAWQQEEYYRLKKRIAEKERVLNAAKERALTSARKSIREGSTQQKQSVNRSDQNSSVVDGRVTKNACQVINGCSIETSGKDCNSNLNMKTASVSKVSVNDQRLKLPQYAAPVKAPPASKLVDSSNLLQGINQMSKKVENLEKEMGNFRSMYKLLIQKKKEFLTVKFNLTKKKKMMFEMREKLISQEKLIEAKMEPLNCSVQPQPNLDQLDPKKLVSRELELCRFKMREFSLRTKMIFDEINATCNPAVGTSAKQVQPSSTVTQMKFGNLNAFKAKDPNVLPPTNNSDLTPTVLNSCQEKIAAAEEAKPNRTKGCSENQSKNWDPFVPICPYDLSGVCKDEECKFQHI